MLTDILLLIILIPLSVIMTLLTSISNIFLNVVPDGVFTTMSTFFSYLGYFNPVFPMDTFAECFLALTTFFYFYYTVKISFWAWSLIPWLGSSNINQLPTLSNITRDYREWKGARKYGKNPNKDKEYKNDWGSMGY